MEAFLKKYAGQIQGVFIHNDDMAIGAIEAIKAAGLKPGDLKMVSVDGTRGGFQAMIDGWMQADVECNPLLGPQVMDLAVKLMNGETDCQGSSHRRECLLPRQGRRIAADSQVLNRILLRA